MGIYIKREKDITLQEWVDYVKTDNNLILMEFGEVINPLTKQKMKMKMEGRALLDDSEIIYKNGYIGCDDYSEKILTKMKEIARSLDAEVLEE